MSFVVTQAGLQTTVQAQPRAGLRHLGVPLCGPADPLSMALANRLLDNPSMTPALEVTLAGFAARFESDTCFAVTGADCLVTLNGNAIEMHRRYRVRAGDELQLGPARQAVRNYLAIGSGLVGEEFLASRSTYLPASFGGFQGRALRNDDEVEFLPGDLEDDDVATPKEFRPPYGGAWVLRACRQKNFDNLSMADQAGLFDRNFTVSARSDRMGMQLQGRVFELPAAGYLDSTPIFPGCLQCPPDGQPYLLSVDAQTTGGYAQLAQVARVDRHLIGQLRAGDHLRLLERTSSETSKELRDKHDYWREWLPDIESVI
jgi:biotin-dependent carboxylase-like uncharacterized protein